MLIALPLHETTSRLHSVETPKLFAEHIRDGTGPVRLGSLPAD